MKKVFTHLLLLISLSILTATILSIQDAAAQSGNTCGTAININTLPYNYTGTTCGAGNNYDNTNILYCYEGQWDYTEGEDMIFEFTASETGCFNVNITNSNFFWTGLHIFDGCPNNPNTTCINFGEGTNTTLSMGLVAGETAAIMVDTWPAPDCTAFTLNITEGASSIVNDDCINAIPLEGQASNYGASCEPNSWAPDNGNTCLLYTSPSPRDA